MSLNILNDLQNMKKIDKGGMLSFCVELPNYCEDALKLADTVDIDYSKPETIGVAGMGGSAIGGELLKDWARGKLKIPVEVYRNYSLPAHLNENTLLFLISYSGETEETLSMFSDAIKKNCMIVCITSGGKLSEFAGKLGIPCLHIPSGIPPRAALPYLFIPQLILLEKMSVVSDVTSEISETLNVLEKLVEKNHPKVNVNQNISKDLALKIDQTSPVIYGFGPYRAVAQRYKQQFNENSKIPARWEIFPEIGHNEIEAWEKPDELAKCFSTIFLRDESEPRRISERINVSKELILKRTSQVFELWSTGKSRLAKMLYTVSIGDFASVYLAILRGVDPSPVRSITLLKKRISRIGVKDKIVKEIQKFSI